MFSFAPGKLVVGNSPGDNELKTSVLYNLPKFCKLKTASKLVISSTSNLGVKKSYPYLIFSNSRVLTLPL